MVFTLICLDGSVECVKLAQVLDSIGLFGCKVDNVTLGGIDGYEI